MTQFQTTDGAGPSPDSVHPRESATDAPTSVSRLNDTINGFITMWGSVWVEGEITSWNLRGGNVFGRMKDLNVDAALSFRLWSTTRQRLSTQPKVGDRVIACVKADFYTKSGDFSFVVSTMRPVGLGDQLERLERLRAKLRTEGLFDSARKRTLPFLPHTIGLITGERSDAEKDVRRNAELRWPQVQFRTVHVAVQGERSVQEIIAALDTLEADPQVEVIIIARGGGDPQTLLGFSDERLVRRAARCATPLVSAIGHENDRPLLDEVADIRASTPTDAAKRVVPDVSEQRALVADLRSRIAGRLSQRLRQDTDWLEQVRSRPVLRTPEQRIQALHHQLWLQVAKGRGLVDRHIESGHRAAVSLRASLSALSPESTMKRGYAIVHREGTIVRSSDQAPAGTKVQVTVAHGSFLARSQGQTGGPVADETAAHTEQAAPSPRRTS